MLPDYGVVIGQHLNYTANQGQWMHVDLNITGGDLTYQAAVDVNEPGGLFPYQVFNNLDASRFTAISGVVPPLVPGRETCYVV